MIKSISSSSLSSSVDNNEITINDDDNNNNNNNDNNDNKRSLFNDYINKMKGKDNNLYPLKLPQNDYSYIDIIISTICSFIFILILACIDNYYLISLNDNVIINILIAAFGATAAIIFTSPNTPFAQPRNVFFGHINSSIIGILTDQICDILSINSSLKAAIALAFSICIMRSHTIPIVFTLLSSLLLSSSLGYFDVIILLVLPIV